MDYIKLSKKMSHALRHKPWEYGLQLDENGWVTVEALLNAFRKDGKWKSLSYKDIQHVVDTCDKKRYEIKDEKIRAQYGHSIPQKIEKELEEPPEILYHGTARMFIDSIKKKGLLPRGRQYVHLSAEIDTAVQVGERRDDQPVLLKIYAKKAYREGVKFYKVNNLIWLADHIDGSYIEVDV
ncbi:MAG: RNA 2'-phosphotransferase [Clostridia bacterium]|nr:RNA 2'-phosphotransferase [Clostridia bacterium]